MGRSKPNNHITSDETWELVNNDNKKLIKEFLEYLHATNHSDKTCYVYESDLRIIMTWILEHCDNKHFTALKKKDYVRFNFYLINDLHHSPNRISSLKAVLSSLSRYIERVCDEDFPDFRNLSHLIEGGGSQPVWEKNIITKEEVEKTIKVFLESGKIQEACIVALIYYSGMRVSEAVQVRVDDFTDEHLEFNGKVYKTHTMRTKGKGKQGKQIGRYVFSAFKPYYDLWLKEREKLGLTEEELFVSKPRQKVHKPMSIDALRTIFTIDMANILGHDVNPHCIRHTFVTENIRDGWSQEAMCDLIQWESVDMVKVYNDASKTENLEKQFAMFEKKEN